VPYSNESKSRGVSRLSDRSNVQRHYIAPYKQRKLKPPPVCGTSPRPRRQRQETYERRKRHRTREDLYEPGKDITKVLEPYPKAERKKMKNDKNKEKSRRNTKARKDLMDNFSSRKVGSDRLTVRDSMIDITLFKLTVPRCTHQND
jgi:hypothetical protein